jgi:asparagine synthetase B (glutamine-hydrolysing)
MSHHAKEVRYPYLSSSVITFLASLPAHIKLDPVQDGGEKRLLRQVSASLGLVGASTRKKRALQFGSRSARMEKGTDVLNRE